MNDSRFVEIIFFVTIIFYTCHSCNEELNKNMALQEEVDTIRNEIQNVVKKTDNLSKELNKTTFHASNKENVKKLYDIMEPDYDMDAIGGIDGFEEWLKVDSNRKFAQDAMGKKYNMDMDFDQFTNALGHYSCDIMNQMPDSLDEITNDLIRILEICDINLYQ